MERSRLKTLFQTGGPSGHDVHVSTTVALPPVNGGKTVSRRPCHQRDNPSRPASFSVSTWILLGWGAGKQRGFSCLYSKTAHKGPYLRHVIGQHDVCYLISFSVGFLMFYLIQKKKISGLSFSLSGEGFFRILTSNHHVWLRIEIYFLFEVVFITTFLNT